MSKTLRTVEAALRATGRPYEIKPGGKHLLVIIDGRRIGCLSKGKHGDNGFGLPGGNILSAIRRHMREIGEKP